MPCIRQFLYDQLNPEAVIPGDRVNLDICPILYGHLKVYKSATAVYYAPSDQSGKGGMHRDVIQCTSSWRGGPAQWDSVFIENGGGDGDGFWGLCWNLYSVYGSYCLLKHSYIAPFLPLVLLSDLLSIL